MIAERLSQVLAARAAFDRGMDFSVATLTGVSIAVIHKINPIEVLKVAVLVGDLILIVWRLWALWQDRKSKRLAREILEEEE